MVKINFLFGIHCHQPLGMPESVIDKAYHRSYLPFFQVMEKHPRIKFAFYISGVLYDWLLAKHPEFLDLLKKLVQRRQAEVFTGGYYHPILSIIPDADKIGQIAMQNDFIQKHLGITPRGLYLAQGVWEPHLSKILSKVGIEYIPLDDYNFLSAGFSKEELSGYYVTEEEGMPLNIFPVLTQLHHLIPFRKAEEIFTRLENLANNGKDRAVVFFDAGEKFGFWPGTFRLAYEDECLESFLIQLENHSSWVQTISFADYCDEFSPSGRAYFSGSSFKNFFVKYPEANNLHKKMLYVSSKLEAVKKSHSQIFEEAKKELYKGQSNSAYWGGMGGGFNLPYLRDAVYEHLIKAENLINKINRGAAPYTELVITDIDKDGHEEILMSNDMLNIYFSPYDGGSIFELDFKSKAYNALNTLAQRKKVRQLLTVESKGEGLEEEIYIPPSYRRTALRDHFFDPQLSLYQLRTGTYEECGDFLDGKYDFFPQRKREEITVAFSKTGTVKEKGGEKVPLKLSKRASLLRGQSIIHIEYQITNLGDEAVDVWFGPEFNFALSAGHAEDRYYEISGKLIKDRHLDSSGILYKVYEVKLIDGYKGFSVSLLFEKEGMLARFPTETVFQSRSGWKKSYQESVLIPIWQLQLEPQKHWTNKITVSFET